MRETVGRQTGRTPRSNQTQNSQVDAVANKLKLNKGQRRMLHNEIGHQGYTYHEILEVAKDMFK